MKKVISMLLSAAILLTATVGLNLTAYATEYSGTCGGNTTWSLDTDTGVLTIYGSGEMEQCTTASEIPWYSYRTYIKTVTISDGITSIANFSFEEYTNLASVEVPAGVTDIGSDAFGKCTSLTEISVSSNNKYYTSTDGVLFNKDETKLVCCPAGKTDVSYTVPDSVTTIGIWTFSGCINLTSVIISDSVTSIKTSAFADCTALTSITIPDSVRDIVYEAFYSCTSLTSITIPNGVTSINDSLFCNCTSLESITIPDSVTSIGNYAFCDCTSLARITIPDSVTSIKTSAFRGCTALTSVTILNYNCDIDYSSDTFYSKATIYGYADSTAQEYAETYDRTFVSFESCTHTYSDGVCTICGCTLQSNFFRRYKYSHNIYFRLLSILLF